MRPSRSTAVARRSRAGRSSAGRPTRRSAPGCPCGPRVRPPAWSSTPAPSPRRRRTGCRSRRWAGAPVPGAAAGPVPRTSRRPRGCGRCPRARTEGPADDAGDDREDHDDREQDPPALPTLDGLVGEALRRRGRASRAGLPCVGGRAHRGGPEQRAHRPSSRRSPGWRRPARGRPTVRRIGRGGRRAAGRQDRGGVLRTQHRGAVLAVARCWLPDMWSSISRASRGRSAGSRAVAQATRSSSSGGTPGSAALGTGTVSLACW